MGWVREMNLVTPSWRPPFVPDLQLDELAWQGG